MEKEEDLHADSGLGVDDGTGVAGGENKVGDRQALVAEELPRAGGGVHLEGIAAAHWEGGARQKSGRRHLWRNRVSIRG